MRGRRRESRYMEWVWRLDGWLHRRLLADTSTTTSHESVRAAFLLLHHTWPFDSAAWMWVERWENMEYRKACKIRKVPNPGRCDGRRPGLGWSRPPCQHNTTQHKTVNRQPVLAAPKATARLSRLEMPLLGLVGGNGTSVLVARCLVVGERMKARRTEHDKCRYVSRLN